MSETLQHGDYVEGLTEDQYRELCELESCPLSWKQVDKGITTDGETLLHRIPNSQWEGTTKHDFETFKQKCINTFTK